ncbi:Patellin-3 [Arthrobotrys entomopaga]|nr:Patellin-3 [Arthrobotrys entomopaga]
MSTAEVQQAPIMEEAPETMNEKVVPVESAPAPEQPAPAPVTETATIRPTPVVSESQTTPTETEKTPMPEPQAIPAAPVAEASTESTIVPEPTPQPTSEPVSTRDYKIAEDEPTLTKTVPYASPDASSHPPPPPELTPEQNAKYEELLSLCKSITEIPISKDKNAEKKPLTDSERMFMTKECLLRYLRATKWNSVEDAKKRIEATLTWRREWGLEEHTPEHIEPENETGKQVLLGFDNDARPCLYLNPAKQNTDKSIRQIQHLTFMMERVLDIAPPGTETLALLIDFKSASSGQNATIGQGKMVMDILQNHYPERLGRALIVNIPWWANLFLKAIWPFIDPVTRPKLKYNEDMSQHVPKSQLLKEFNGDVDFTYDHAAYWPNFIKLAADKRKRYEERWKANGSQIGESEFYLKGGEKSKPIATDTPAEAGPSVEAVTEGMQNTTV